MVMSWRMVLAWALLMFVVGAFALTLAPLTQFWWLVLIVPIMVAIPMIWATKVAASQPLTTKLGPQEKQRQLLEALATRGELTAMAAALHTSLTIDEAATLLDDLAAKGHLQAQVSDGIMVYAFFERDRPSAPQLEERGAELEPQPVNTALAPSHSPDTMGAPPHEVTPLVEPLSEREHEVLRLLASGRTNAEIAGDLFVATGTVKAHVNNIYRKLAVRNRTEAMARARDLQLLG